MFFQELCRIVKRLYQFADVDECAQDNGGCTEHSTCHNTPGSYDCVCDTGYKAQGPLCVGKLLVFLSPNLVTLSSKLWKCFSFDINI